MTEVTITEAQQRLPELLSAAEAGELVRIRSDTGRHHHALRSARRTPIQSRLARLSIPRQRQRVDRSHRGIR